MSIFSPLKAVYIYLFVIELLPSLSMASNAYFTVIFASLMALKRR